MAQPDKASPVAVLAYEIDRTAFELRGPLYHRRRAEAEQRAERQVEALARAGYRITKQDGEGA